jgi:hypothetical protein
VSNDSFLEYADQRVLVVCGTLRFVKKLVEQPQIANMEGLTTFAVYLGVTT